MTSDMALAVTPVLNEARILGVSPTVTTQKLSGRDDFFFRVSATTGEYATRSARYHAKAVDRFQREPGFPGVFSHDAIQVILTALRAQESGQDLKATILALRQFKGLQGDFSFDEFGDVKRSNASISVVRNQQFAVLE